MRTKGCHNFASLQPCVRSAQRCVCKSHKGIGTRSRICAESGVPALSGLREGCSGCLIPPVPHAAPWTHAVFQNPSTENRTVAGLLKQAGTKILYVYHEPWQQLPSYLRGEGLSGTLKAILAHHTSVSVLKLADTVMLASQYGLNEYGKSDVRYNRNSEYIPLLFDDDAPKILRTCCRQSASSDISGTYAVHMASINLCLSCGAHFTRIKTCGFSSRRDCRSPAPS